MRTHSNDWFYALGEFRIEFTGSYNCEGSDVHLDGTFTIVDRYDWQNPGDKYVELGGDRIYDRYATRVEDWGFAEPFDVRGTITAERTFQPTKRRPSGASRIR